MPQINLRAALELFDFQGPGPRIPNRGRLVGLVSSVLGETLLVDLVADALSTTDKRVVVSDLRPPYRDDSAFTVYPKPPFRDLDAWLHSESKDQWWAVEAKCRTSSSIDALTFGADPVRRYNDIAQEFHPDAVWWTSTNKVALPVVRPMGCPATFDRVLAIWRPTTSSPGNWWSTIETSTLQDDVWKDVTVLSSPRF